MVDVASAFRPDGLGAIISASRSVIFAHRESRYSGISKDRWVDAVQQSILETKAQIANAIPAFQ